MYSPLKIVIFGAGQLGEYIHANCSYPTTLLSHKELDICNKDMVKDIISKYDIIINCAAYTNVDKAETDVDTCITINGDALEYIAYECYKQHRKLIHISTDFVYGNISYKYLDEALYENETLNPINTYGYSKLVGEKNILKWMTNNFLILRVSWLFGDKINFVDKIVKNIINPPGRLVVVDDQVGRPTSTKLVTNVILEYLNGKLPDGIYNLQNSGKLISKYEFAKYIRNYLKRSVKIYPIKTDNSGNKFAKRQFNSNLSCKKIDEYCKSIRSDWEEDVNLYLNKLIIKYNIRRESLLIKLKNWLGVK